MISQLYDGLFNWLEKQLIYRVFDRFAQKNGSLMAAGISYYAMLSLFPFIMVAFAIFGIYLKREDIFVEIINYIGTIIPQALVIIEDNLEFLVRTTRINSLIGVVGLIWTSNKIFCATENALHQIWNIKSGRQYIIHKMRNTILVVPLVTLLYFSLVMTSVMQTILSLPFEFFNLTFYNRSFLITIAKILIPTSLSTLFFYTIYRFIPKVKMRRRYVITGAASAAFIWEISKYLFTIYLNYIMHSFSFYGSLATLLIMIFWIYFSANIFLLGAELAYQLKIKYEPPKKH